MSVTSVHQFNEKVCLITNGTAAAGKAAVLQLALQGAFIIAGAENETAAEQAGLNELRSLGAMANVLIAEINSEAGTKKLIDEAFGIYGRLDLFVNYVGGEKKAGRQLSDIFASVNTVTKYAANLMNERPSPRMVNVFDGFPVGEAGPSNDLLRKEIFELAGSVVKELPSKFRANYVVIKEETNNRMSSDADILRPPGVISPDDTARVICFLLSPEAKALNGQVLFVS